MPWGPEIPELDLKKPEAIVWLESMGDDVLNAMDPVERDKRIHDSAYELAKAYYHKEKTGTFEGCVSIVSMALSVTGNGIGGVVGNEMVGKSDPAAREACRLVYPNEILDVT